MLQEDIPRPQQMLVFIFCFDSVNAYPMKRDSAGEVDAVHGMGELVSLPITRVVPREGYLESESKESHRNIYFVYYDIF